MKLESLRKHRRFSRWFAGAFGMNTVLIAGLALPFAVVATSSLKNAAAISILFACITIPTVLLAFLIGKYLPKLLAPVVYSLFSMALLLACTPLINPISPGLSNTLGIYIPILAVNSSLFVLCEQYSAPCSRPIFALVDAVMYSVGFAFAMGLIACIREWLGNGTLWGVAVPGLPFKLAGLQFAFAGFILAAVFSAFFRFVKRTIIWLYYRHDNPLHPKQKTAR